MNNYKISIIIATYNTADYLEECLDSIFSQTLKEIEVVLIDDGSTDNTGDIIDRYKEGHNNLLSIRQENQGAGRARNYGIMIATGEYMIFMDPDDKYPETDSLEKLYVTIKKYKVSIVGGNILRNDNGRIKGWYMAGDGEIAGNKNDIISIENYSFIYGHTRYLFKANLIKDNHVEYAHYRNYEDQVFTMDALGAAGCFYELDYPVYEYRIIPKHKKRDFYDTLCGFRDALKSIIKYNMRLMFEKNYCNFVDGNMYQITKYVFNGSEKFDRVIEEINSLVRESNWNCGGNYEITLQRVINYRKAIADMKGWLKQIFSSKAQIIIYGAGQNARRLISAYRSQIENVIGIAVSDLEDNSEEYEGIPVRSIDDYVLYKESAVVLITPSAKVKEEIISVLDRMGFNHYRWIDVRMIEP